MYNFVLWFAEAMLPAVKLSPGPVAFAGTNLRSRSASVSSVSSLKPSKFVVSSFRPLYLAPLDGPRAAGQKAQRQPLEFRCAASAADDKESKTEVVPVRSEAAQKLKISIYFATWWALNVIFNIYNKKVLNAFPYPWLTSTLSLACGSAMMLVSWATRLVEAPKTDLDFWKVLFPVSGIFFLAIICIFAVPAWASMIDFGYFPFEGCCGSYNWACCCDSEYVKSSSVIHTHYQKCRACIQCFGIKVPSWGDVSGSCISFSSSNHWWMCSCCCHRAEL